MERLGILKLNGSNYSIWKTKVEFLLIRDDLWRYVIGAKPAVGAAVRSTTAGATADSAASATTGTATTSGATAAEIEAWTTGDQKARATIGLLLEDNQLNLIKACKTAKETWEALRNHYEKATLTSKVSLLKQICDKRYTDGEDIERHVFELEELFERLSVAGQVLERNLQVAMVLRSLPETFNTLTTALEARSDDELTLELIKSKLTDEVSKRGSRMSSESVLKADGAKQKKTVICHNCQKPGHKQRQCRALMEKRTGDSRSSDQKEKRYHPKAKTAREESEDRSSPDFSFLALHQVSGRKAWIVDSGATSHMCVDADCFETLDESVKQDVYLADGKKITTEGVGSCKLIWESPEGKRYTVLLTDVMYVPQFETNLISVKKLATKGVKLVFDADGCRIFKDDRIIGDTITSGGLYELRTVVAALRVSETKHNPDCLHTWHRILGHREPDAIRELQTKGLATGIRIKDCGCYVTCECCVEGKLARLPFPKQSKKKSKQPMDLIHTDVCGPMNTPTPGGCRYFLTMIDDHSRYTVVYFL